MRLPNAEKAVVPKEKLTEYLVSTSHPVGRLKAAFFASFGFSVDAWEVLAAALTRHAGAHGVASAEESEYGTRYAVVGPLESPDGRQPMVRSVWFIERGASVPRFVTAYPGRRREDT